MVSKIVGLLITAAVVYFGYHAIQNHSSSVPLSPQEIQNGLQNNASPIDRANNAIQQEENATNKATQLYNQAGH